MVFQNITERKRDEANKTLLAEMDRDISNLNSARELMEVVGAKIGAYLQVETCNYCEVNNAQETITVIFGWRDRGAPDLLCTFNMSEYYSEDLKRASHNGETIAIHDTQTDPRSAAQRYAALKIGTFLSVPFHKNGAWINSLTLTGAQSRDWRQDEIQLFQEVANRVFSRIERVHAEQSLAESEARYRSLVENANEAIAGAEKINQQSKLYCRAQAEY